MKGVKLLPLMDGTFGAIGDSLGYYLLEEQFPLELFEEKKNLLVDETGFSSPLREAMRQIAGERKILRFRFVVNVKLMQVQY